MTACTEKYFFLFLNQNICCGYSKEWASMMIMIMYNSFLPKSDMDIWRVPIETMESL